MRCPECNTRNSVAAHTCIQCGYKFKRKPLPAGLKFAACAAIICGALWATATYILPGIIDPEKNLRNIAKRVAAGPKSPGESVWMLRQFNGSIERYLEKFGELSAPQLTADLRKLLPASAFEVYVVNLPQHLKLVEVDTLLQGNSFLLMNNATTNGTSKVVPIHGLEVYEDNRLISDAAGPILVLLGHSGGQPPHTPQVKVFAVLPTDVSDESEKSVPHIVGEGAAHFIGASHEIVAELSLVSIGQIEGVLNSVSPRDDSAVHQYLIWADNKYTGNRTPTDTPLGALYTLAYCMQNDKAVDANEPTLGAVGIRFAKEHHSDQPCNFKVEREKVMPNKTEYLLSNNDRNQNYDVVVAHGRKAGWRIASIAPAAPPSAVATTDQGVPGQVAKVSEAVMSVAQPEKPKPPEAVTGSKITELSPEKAANAPATSKTGGAKTAAAHKNKGGTKLANAQLPSAVWVDSSHKAIPLPKLPDQLVQASKIVQEVHMPGSLLPKPPVQIVKRKVESPSSEIAINGTTLRSSPSAKATALTHLAKGTKVEIVGKEGSWCKVKINGKQGYVFGTLINTTTTTAQTLTQTSTKKEKTAVANAPKSKPAATSAPKSTNANVPKPAAKAGNTATVILGYQLHDYNHKPIAPLAVGEHLKVLSGLEGHRYQVQLPDGTTGYVDKDALDIGGGSKSKAKAAAKAPTPPQFVP